MNWVDPSLEGAEKLSQLEFQVRHRAFCLSKASGHEELQLWLQKSLACFQFYKLYLLSLLYMLFIVVWFLVFSLYLLFKPHTSYFKETKTKTEQGQNV